MGTRVTFNQRGRGCIVKDGSVVSSLQPRVRFRRGWETGGADPGDGSVECGNGTAYSMLMTVDEMLEVFTRAKDCTITSGQIILDGASDQYTLGLSGVARAAQLYNYVLNDGDVVSSRGFYASAELASPNEPIAHAGAGLFGTTYYYPEDPGFTRNMAVRDILDKEQAMWINGQAAAPRDPTWIGKFLGSYSLPTQILSGAGHAVEEPSYRTAFNHMFEDTSYNSADSPNLYGLFWSSSIPDNSECTIHFTGNVAFIDTTGSGNPYDPGNKLYAEFVFKSFYAAGAAWISSINELPPYIINGTMASTGVSLQIVLSSSTISCPLYFLDTESDAITDQPFSIFSASNIVLTTDKWWPYAKPGGGDKWDANTGLLL